MEPNEKQNEDTKKFNIGVDPDTGWTEVIPCNSALPIGIHLLPWALTLEEATDFVNKFRNTPSLLDKYFSR